jgi:L-2-aminoadipate reductase
MDQVQATVTHLTPGTSVSGWTWMLTPAAMGQLLSTEANTAIPSLRNAFFVGDVLTKRDCLRLQSLASNVTIINMYGTTETQRAVSYFPIPPLSTDPVFLKGLKDIMPAGRGMKDVQLLVVNRTDRNSICGIGEIGELYVRAGGLAEGYLKLPDLTEQKFVRNWLIGSKSVESNSIPSAAWATYYLGPRDRLYRTGDLGRYLPNGDGTWSSNTSLIKVECVGRADDQVKIRGFRIELGEIDTYLTQHPLVRENVTLVRRDKDEEPTLVSYIVPQQSAELSELLSDGDDDDGTNDDLVRGLRKHRKLIKNIREHLKSKLPAYAVPTGSRLLILWLLTWFSFRSPQ